MKLACQHVYVCMHAGRHEPPNHTHMHPSILPCVCVCAWETHPSKLNHSPTDACVCGVKLQKWDKSWTNWDKSNLFEVLCSGVSKGHYCVVGCLRAIISEYHILNTVIKSYRVPKHSLRWIHTWKCSWNIFWVIGGPSNVTSKFISKLTSLCFTLLLSSFFL